MVELEEVLAEWRNVKPRNVSVALLTTDPAFQPRASSCVSFAQVNAEERRSEDHICVMASRLSNKSVEVEPLLVLRTEAALIVLDGHHRLEAYRKARRETIPARILSTDPGLAVLISKLVNFGGEKMGMHPDQRRDAAWQVLSKATNHGRLPLPAGTTQRTFASQFGISLGNVNAMLARLREHAIEPNRYQSEHCDPGTGWPRWPYARNKQYGRDWSPPPHDQLRLQVVSKLARAIAEAAEKTDVGVLREAIEQLSAFGWDTDAVNEAQLASAEFCMSEESDY